MATAVPAPLSADGEVTFDPVTRSLLARARSGWARLIWDRGHAAMVRDAGTFNENTVYCHTNGARDVARGEAVADKWLRFRLPEADYRQLAREDTKSIVIVDKEAGRILGVRFLG